MLSIHFNMFFDIDPKKNVCIYTIHKHEHKIPMTKGMLTTDYSVLDHQQTKHILTHFKISFHFRWLKNNNFIILYNINSRRRFKKFVENIKRKKIRVLFNHNITNKFNSSNV